MQHRATPGPHALPQQTAQFGLLLARPLAAFRPPAHRCEGGCATAPQNEQPQPVQTRHTNRTTAGWVEEPRTDAFEAARFAGAHRTQIVVLDRLGLFQHTAIPDEKWLLATRAQGLNASIGLLPEPVGKQAGLPTLGAQEIAQALGTGWSVLGREQVGTEFGEQ